MRAPNTISSQLGIDARPFLAARFAVGAVADLPQMLRAPAPGFSSAEIVSMGSWGWGGSTAAGVAGGAGLGESGTDGTPKTIEAHLQDLGAVIDALAPDRKVVLVGHSYGGLLATEFARLHPGRVQGLVLVDPATMGQRHAFKAANLERVLADDKTLLSVLPPKMAEDYVLLVAQLDSATAAAEHGQADVPVALLTSTQVAAEPFVLEETAQGKAIWKRQHAALFAGYSRGTHRYFDTGHNIHREDPKAVADAIRSVVAAAQDKLE